MKLRGFAQAISKVLRPLGLELTVAGEQAAKERHLRDQADELGRMADRAHALADVRGAYLRAISELVASGRLDDAGLRLRAVRAVAQAATGQMEEVRA